jgi:TetR/AcrR family transcriptional regulator
MCAMTNTQTHRLPAADRQQKLLEAALKVFSRRGFKGSTTKEIAAAAGVTEAIIFQHFPSKEALYSAVLELHLDAEEERRWAAEVGGYMENSDDEGLLRAFVHRILRSYRRDTALQRVVLFAALEGHEQGLMRLRQQFAPVYEKMVSYIARRQREGAFVDCDPHIILLGFGAFAHQYGLLKQIFRATIPDVPDETMAQLFTEILMNGVCESSPRRPERPAGKRNRKAKK